MELTLENLNKAASTNGVIIGILSTVIGIVTFYVFPALLGSMSFGIATLFVSLLIYIFFTIDLRKKIGGFWSFREALKGIFLMSFVAGLIYSLSNVVFYKFIEPGAFDKIAGFMESGMSQTFENMGMEQEKIDETVAKQIEGIKAQYDPTLAQFFKNLGIAIIIQFVMSLIFAAIFKKEAPVFASIGEDEEE
ncbi:MAG: DUF4199 domain-containing protein [Daejeonella sp.]|uniref:DUF4199 domain-containing protein n=1 Tax=Daejeonella sp. TaxID=2805397 RepID=UPI002733E3EA|nr:DUF4199 domain-containing protein [Daejeonella sp.]MDP3468301.1 DUF4199 domain-containing protein [Daejeonella sp.]